MSETAALAQGEEPKKPRRRPVEIVKAQPITLAENIERVLIGGDLGALKPEERVSYYNAVCKSLGLNPLTKPFDYITLNGKLTLYAKRDCTDQLRRVHGVSILELHVETVGDIRLVAAKAQDKTGRTDFSTGAVNVKGLAGDNLANALMKAETKAKRRVTLSICGLGLLDETELETIPEVKANGAGAAARPVTAPETGAIAPASLTPPPTQPPKAELPDANKWLGHEKTPLGTGRVTSAVHKTARNSGKEYVEVFQQGQTLRCFDKGWFDMLLASVGCDCIFRVITTRKDSKDWHNIQYPLSVVNPQTGEVNEWEMVDGKVVPVIQRGREPGEDAPDDYYEEDGQ